MRFTFDQFLTWAAENNKPDRPVGAFEQNPPAKGPAKPPPTKTRITYPLARDLSEAEKSSLVRCSTIEPPRDLLE